MNKLYSWLGTDAERWETASFDPLRARGFQATGWQAGVDPLPYQLSYKLDVRGGAHSHLAVWAEGEGWTRTLFLRRSQAGVWSWRALATGDCELPDPGAPPDLADQLAGALHCDLGLSPLTNWMPVRRNNLHLEPGSADIVVAWIAVPELTLHAAPQRYEHLRTQPGGSAVRFTALDDGFTADLELDSDGVVLTYPGLARRARPTEQSIEN